MSDKEGEGSDLSVAVEVTDSDDEDEYHNFDSEEEEEEFDSFTLKDWRGVQLLNSIKKGKKLSILDSLKVPLAFTFDGIYVFMQPDKFVIFGKEFENTKNSWGIGKTITGDHTKDSITDLFNLTPKFGEMKLIRSDITGLYYESELNSQRLDFSKETDLFWLDNKPKPASETSMEELVLKNEPPENKKLRTLRFVPIVYQEADRDSIPLLISRSEEKKKKGVNLSPIVYKENSQEKGLVMLARKIEAMIDLKTLYHSAQPLAFFVVDSKQFKNYRSEMFSNLINGLESIIMQKDPSLLGKPMYVGIYVYEPGKYNIGNSPYSFYARKVKGILGSLLSGAKPESEREKQLQVAYTVLQYRTKYLLFEILNIIYILQTFGISYENFYTMNLFFIDPEKRDKEKFGSENPYFQVGDVVFQRPQVLQKEDVAVLADYQGLRNFATGQKIEIEFSGSGSNNFSKLGCTLAVPPEFLFLEALFGKERATNVNYRSTAIFVAGVTFLELVLGSNPFLDKSIPVDATVGTEPLRVILQKLCKQWSKTENFTGRVERQKDHLSNEELQEIKDIYGLEGAQSTFKNVLQKAYNILTFKSGKEEAAKTLTEEEIETKTWELRSDIHKLICSDSSTLARYAWGLVYQLGVPEGYIDYVDETNRFNSSKYTTIFEWIVSNMISQNIDPTEGRLWKRKDVRLILGVKGVKLLKRMLQFDPNLRGDDILDYLTPSKPEDKITKRPVKQPKGRNRRDYFAELRPVKPEEKGNIWGSALSEREFIDYGVYDESF